MARVRGSARSPNGVIQGVLGLKSLVSKRTLILGVLTAALAAAAAVAASASWSSAHASAARMLPDTMRTPHIAQMVNPIDTGDPNVKFTCRRPCNDVAPRNHKNGPPVRCNAWLAAAAGWLPHNQVQMLCCVSVLGQLGSLSTHKHQIAEGA